VQRSHSCERVFAPGATVQGRRQKAIACPTFGTQSSSGGTRARSGPACGVVQEAGPRPIRRALSLRYGRPQRHLNPMEWNGKAHGSAGHVRGVGYCRGLPAGSWRGSQVGKRSPSRPRNLQSWKARVTALAPKNWASWLSTRGSFGSGRGGTNQRTSHSRLLWDIDRESSDRSMPRIRRQNVPPALLRRLSPPFAPYA
jgi:hypothetical protein